MVRPAGDRPEGESEGGVSEQRVVAAVDGSEGSRRALRFAAGEARLRGAALEIVLVWSLAAQPKGQPFDPHHGEAEAGRELARFVDETFAADRPAGTRLTVVNDLPAKGILRAAEGALLLVVGSRGLGVLTRLRLGSVSSQIVHHAPCPVAVVP